jgi:hypothetical protein
MIQIIAANTRIWLHGLFAAFISTFATSASGFITLPTVFNFTHDGMINMVKLATVPALGAAFFYLKTSPLPPLMQPGDQLAGKNVQMDVAGNLTADSAILTKAPDAPKQ